MKRLTALSLGLLVSLGLALSANAAPQFGARDRGQNQRDRVCVYQDINYQGWEQCYNEGDEVTSLDRRNNAISSIRIYGRAHVTVYEDTQFRGHSAEFDSSVPDLGRRSMQGSKSWSDHIQSIRIGGSYAGGGRDYPAYPSGGRDVYPNGPDRRNNNARNSDGICVYDRRNFEGREECFDAGAEVSDLARAGNWSDRIQSIRVFGRTQAVLYRDIGFRGASVRIDRDMPDLSQLTANGFGTWSRQISSLFVQDDRPGRGRGRARNWR
jgi:hypothetical protein